MTILCFDISSGGISAALYTPELEVIRVVDDHWELAMDRAGAATLSFGTITARFKQAVADLHIVEPLQGICIGSFMHNCLLLDGGDQPITPVFTWLDRRGEDGVDYIQRRLGERFHRRTGCRFHPMFPVFKLATLYLTDSRLIAQASRVVSIKTFLIRLMTGIWKEDHGMASASGLYNVGDGDWDPLLLSLLGLKPETLPAISGRNEIVGHITQEAAREFELPLGTPVINGSGDGFLAAVGSDCEIPAKISVTLGTSAVARQTLFQPILDSSSGTFCYKADANAYLLGCAGSNGGNVLDWGRSLFGDVAMKGKGDIPIFIPLLHGERSPEWDSNVKGSWHNLTALQTLPELARSVVEGVVFNLGHYVEILQRTSGESAAGIVLSGNGFLHPLTAPLLAAVAGMPVWIPSGPGMASLRGAAICALRALVLPVPRLHIDEITPFQDERLSARYQRYKELRVSAG